MTSLRHRLLVFLLGLAALAAGVVAAGTYRAVLSETEALADYHLRQMALLLRDQGATPAEAVAALEAPPFDYVVQIWSADGAEIYSSHPDPTPLRPLAALLRTRPVESLAPLPATGLPAEVAPLVTALNTLLQRLQAAFDAQRAFVADAAHELRTPLTALKLQIELLGREGSAPAQAVAELMGGMQRAQRLVEQLLALARAEPGGAEVPQAPVDLAEVARLAVAEAVPLAVPRGTQLAFEVDESGPLLVQGDAQALRGLVRNLVDNAVRYAGAGAQVQVRVQRPGPDVLLQVEDSGPGIPPAERERVFARFYRRDGQAETGSGLGLAIVQAVARRHQASVTLGDSPLGGLRVEVRWAGGGAGGGASAAS